MNDLSVAVIGAGMGGLTTAIALRQAGFDAHVYEQAPALEPIGAGISLWPNGVKVLNLLGVGEQLARAGARLDGVRYRDAAGELLTDIPLAPLVDVVGEHAYPVARADLHELLMERLGPEHVTLGARCVAVEQDGDGVTARFADGRRSRAGVLVGADGIRSAVRALVFPSAPQPRYAGNVTWVGMLPDRGLEEPGRFTLYVGDCKRVGAMPVGGGRLYAFFDVPCPPGTLAAAAAAPLEQLRALFAGWCPAVQSLLERLDPSAVVPLEIHDMDPLEHVVHGRVALLGDAAHAATPSLGQNGAQALEDALVLAQSLRATTTSPEGALRSYERQRRDRTAEIVRRARARTDVIIGAEPDATERWYADLRERSGGEFVSLQTEVALAGPLG